MTRARGERAPTGRWRALASLVALALVTSCGARGAATDPSARPVEPPPGPPLRLEPAVDLVPAAGVLWLVASRPREFLSVPALRDALATVIPDARFESFARRHGGVDPRRIDELVVAAFPAGRLVVARGALDPARVEAAFVARAESVVGRASEGAVRRVWGNVAGEPEALAIFARDGLALERGAPGPLRASIYFAEQRLRRSLPALRAEPLQAAAALAGDAPLRAFAPGPFTGEGAAGVAGLLRATTAVAASLRPLAAPPDGAVLLRVVLTGAWGDDAPAAAERLRAAFGVLSADPLGRLTGLDRPIREPVVSAEPAALRLEVVLDALALARGLHAAADASVAEVMDY
jgi:hypothetical protein